MADIRDWDRLRDSTWGYRDYALILRHAARGKPQVRDRERKAQFASLQRKRLVKDVAAAIAAIILLWIALLAVGAYQ